MDPYSTLGLSRGASNDDVKKAYRQLVLQFHPDRHASSSEAEQEAAAARFKVITEAYDILSDERARAQYHTSASSRSASAAYRHPGVNTDWSHSHYTGGSGYTSRISRWDLLWRLTHQGMRSFGQTLHLGLAVLLVGGGLLFEFSHSALWQARNKGKSFEEMQEAIRAQREHRADRSSSNKSGGSGGGSSSTASTGQQAGDNSSSSSGSGSGSSGGKVWHLHSAWADNMRGRFVPASEDTISASSSSSR